MQALENELAAVPSPSTTLLEVVLQGVLDLTRYEHAATTLPARFDGVFHHLRWNTRDLHVRLSDNDFDALPREGWAGRMVQRLREGRVSGADAEACQRALQQLHRIQLAARFAGGARSAGACRSVGGRSRRSACSARAAPRSAPSGRA